MPWNKEVEKYTTGQINLGSNPISKLEIVSSLNSFNLGRMMYHYNYTVCTQKYNLKVYFGTIQSVNESWNWDNNMGLSADQKSGSCV